MFLPFKYSSKDLEISKLLKNKKQLKLSKKQNFIDSTKFIRFLNMNLDEREVPNLKPLMDIVSNQKISKSKLVHYLYNIKIPKDKALSKKQQKDIKRVIRKSKSIYSKYIYQKDISYEYKYERS